MDQAVDVVIRTAGQNERVESLRRAVASVQNQHGVSARPIIVLTGSDPAAVVTSRPGVKMHHVGEQISPGRAASVGRKLVEADFYAFLDDDDELLPHAAEHSRQARQLGKAWRLHLKSMKVPSTLRYAAYTRKLLWNGRPDSDLPAPGGFSRNRSGNG